jgi:hypothetical protein
MRIGINISGFNYYHTHTPSPDLFATGVGPSLHRRQTTLAAEHAPGSGVFVVADPDVFRPPRTRPGSVVGISQFSIPAVSGRVRVVGWTVAGTPYVFATSFAEGADATFPAGTIVDETTNWWGQWSDTPADWPLASIRPDGYPTGLGVHQVVSGVVSQGQVLPGGTYTATALGTGRLHLDWTLLGGGADSAEIAFGGGTTSGTFAPAGPIVSLSYRIGSAYDTLTWSDPADPLHAVRVLMPGLAAGYEGQPDGYFGVHPDFAADLDGFRILRFMDLQATNHSPVVDWSDRAPGGTHLGLEDEVPYEWLIRFVDESGADPWICVPHAATDAYAAALAAFLRDNLDPVRKAYVEYSNETWNGIMVQARHCLHLGVAEFHPGRVDSLAYSGGTCTVTKAAHGWSNGAVIQVCNASDAAYNGAYSIAVTGDDTFTYTPGSAPSASPATPTASHRILALDTASGSARVASSASWSWSSSSAPVTVTTSSAHGLASGDIVQICNATDPAFNGLFAAEVAGASTFAVAFDAAGRDRPLPAATGTPTAAAAVAGQSLRVFRLAGDSPPADGVNNFQSQLRYHGRRAAEIHAIFRDAFAGQHGRLALVVGGFTANPSNSETVADQWVADSGGSAPAGSEAILSTAPYFYAEGLAEADVIGPLEDASSLTRSGSTATATVASHGYTTGDQVQILNATQPEYCGIFAITVTGTDTFTFAVDGTPATPATPYYSGMGGIRAMELPSGAREITAVARSGETLTLTSRGHGFAAGADIALGNFDAVYRVDGAYQVASVPTADTFTVQVPGLALDPATAGGERAWAITQALVDVVLDACEANLTGATFNDALADTQAVAAAAGMEVVCYEGGQHLVPTGANQNVRWLDLAYRQANRDPRMGELYLLYRDRLRAGGVAGICFFVENAPPGKYGSWGAKEYQDDADAPKWTAIRSLLSGPTMRLAVPAGYLTLLPPA